MKALFDLLSYFAQQDAIMVIEDDLDWKCILLSNNKTEGQSKDDFVDLLKSFVYLPSTPADAVEKVNMFFREQPDGLLVLDNQIGEEEIGSHVLKNIDEKFHRNIFWISESLITMYSYPNIPFILNKNKAGTLEKIKSNFSLS